MSERIFPAELGRKRVTIDSRAADGDGVLHNLLYGREYYPIKLLIGAGADVNLVGNLGQTPLRVAVWRDHAEAVDLLLSAGAKPDVCCEFGRSPLDMAAERGLRDILRLLKQFE